jgi:hypothetical protein
MNDDKNCNEDSVDAHDAIAFAEFLEKTPPFTKVWVNDLYWHESGGWVFNNAELTLHCESDDCKGLRFFRRIKSGKIAEEMSYHHIMYQCSNCRNSYKVFSVAITEHRGDISSDYECYKLGEDPAFGPPTPPRLLRLLGTDRDLFLKGRRCENKGLGIGAFVYYRRVVEAQKDRIFDEIIKVSKKLNAPEAAIKDLEAGRSEIQFSKALKVVKDAIPQALLINGQNPILLLHNALSDGLHDQTDEHCLELAHDVRVVLVELSERLGQVLKDETELNTAVSRLMKVKNTKETP